MMLNFIVVICLAISAVIAGIRGQYLFMALDIVLAALNTPPGVSWLLNKIKGK